MSPINDAHGMSRRTAIRLLVGSAVLPPVLGAFSPAAAENERRSAQDPLPAPLRTLDKPGLQVEEVMRVSGPRHRVTFLHATWDGGQTYVRDLEARLDDGGWIRVTDPERRFDEQWVVFTGDEAGNPNDYYTSMIPHWVGFDSIRQLGKHTVELSNSAPGRYDLTVRWNLEGDNPELQWTMTAGPAAHYVVGYQSFDPLAVDDVDEVLCGSLQHARVVRGAESLGAWELFAPMSLTERRVGDRPVTLGVYTPGDVIEFEHERELGPDGQPFGMSLRNNDRDVQPVMYAPQSGRRSELAAGERIGYAFGVVARPGSLYDAYTELTRDEYGYTDYRRNVYDTSLTQTAFNLIELCMVEPDGDDSETFVPSYGGWWSRAKGYVDIENDQAVRTPIAGVLLSAYYLTGWEGLYEKRARPLLEYHLSRPNHGSTPIKGKPVYGNLELYRIGRIPGDASTLVPLYRQTRGQNAGIHELAMRMIRERPPRDARTPMSTPLQAYVLTENPAYLAEARAEGRRYLRDQIHRAYTANEAENGFGYNYVKAWTELLVLYELTGDEEFLDASYREAQRYVTLMAVRPVPDTTVTVPNQPFIDHQLDRWAEGALLPDYPRTTVESEDIPAWMVSSSGVTFEQLTTYKIGAGRENPGGGYTWIPAWAPFLLRLAQHTGDRLLRDVAHNLVIGRYTNYPGYYNRQFSVTQMKPDYPYQGPPGVSSIYFHHIPGQLGMTLDYLISEHVVRSEGAIDFPKEFETNYVFFKYHTYGHAPGEFYGDGGVWPYFPPGIIEVSSPQINWITAVGNGSLYISLTNENDDAERVTVDVATALTGVQRRRRYDAEIIRDNGEPNPTTLYGGKLTTTVSGKGITAIIVRGVEAGAPWHWTPDATDRSSLSHSSEDIDPDSDQGLVRAVLLVRPDRSGYDAYVQIDTETPARLEYSIGDGDRQQAPAKPFPFEWTIPVDDLTAGFTFQVSAGERRSEERTLRLPPSVTGMCPPGVVACGEVVTAPDTTPGDSVRVTTRIRSASDLREVTVELGLPDGWTAEPAGEVPNAVPEGTTATWEFDVSIPADAEPDGYRITASAAWAGGGTAELEPAGVEVMAPMKITALTAEPDLLAKPGDSLELTVAVLNMGPVPRSGPLELGVPAGWQLSAGIDVDVPGREEREYTVTVASPADAQPGSAHRISAALPGGAESAVTVRVAGTDIIVDNDDPWPAYQETGWWMPSGLRGWNGTSTRYSEEERLGGTATWRPEIPEAGYYDVAVWYPTNPDTTTAAAYIVQHADGAEEFIVNQQEGANGWRSLGRFRFEAGGEGYVRLEVRNPDFHRVDAARFSPVDGEDLLPTIRNLAAEPVTEPGATTTLRATVEAGPNAPVQGQAMVSTPDGWTVTPAEAQLDLAAGASTEVAFELTAPADAVVGSQHEVVLDAAGAVAATVVAVGEADASAFVVVDNEDPGYTEEGSWYPSSLAGHDGSGSRYAGGNTGALARWTPDLSADGRYRVSVWYPSNSTTTTQANYIVAAAGGEVSVVVDQTQDAGTWRQLGIVDLVLGSAEVRLSAVTSGHHRADAARFEPVIAASRAGDGA